MDSSATAPQTVRRPTQERGRRRFDAILDAAAAILVESGMAGFTMHGVAARASTSIGSMYHFFPDGESVLQALGERHVAAIQSLLEAIRQTDDATWANAPLSVAVETMVNPILSYMQSHPDLFVLAQMAHHQQQPPRDDCGPEGHGLDTISIDTYERFIAARTPSTTVAERQLRARMVHSITEGAAMRAAFYPPTERTQLLNELRVAVTAYLATYEAR